MKAEKRRVPNPFEEVYREDLPGIFNEAQMILQQQERLKVLDQGKVVPPYEVIIHPSGKCNLACPWCIGSKIQDGTVREENLLGERLPTRFTDPANMEKLITELATYQRHGFGVENVSFSGITGEPLVGQEAFVRAVEILKDEADRDFRVGIFSNSQLITPEIREALLKIDYINVSLDAGTAETFASLKYGGKPQGEEVFRQIIDKVRELARARDEQGSGLNVNASFLLHPENYTEIYDAAVMLKDLGVNTMRMKQDISGGRLLTAAQLEEAAALIEQASQLQDDDFHFIQVHPTNEAPVTTRTFGKCRVSDLWGAIGSDGKVYPCNYNATAGALSYGSVIEQSFPEVWEGEKRMVAREELPTGCPDVCDPFKTRANNMLELFAAISEEGGFKHAVALLEEIASLPAEE